MSFKIGTVVINDDNPLKIGTEKVGVMKTGTEIIYRSVPVNTQVISVGGATIGVNQKVWVPSPEPAIDEALRRNASQNVTLNAVQFFSDGRVRLDLNPNAPAGAGDLSDRWETQGSMRIQIGSVLDITLQASAINDTAEPYDWPAGTISSSQYGAINTSASDQATITVTLADG